jgi:hypothetical protein
MVRGIAAILPPAGPPVPLLRHSQGGHRGLGIGYGTYMIRRGISFCSRSAADVASTATADLYPSDSH